MYGIVSFSELPPELIWQIVRGTDSRNLSFRLVCQAWNRMMPFCLEEVNTALRGSLILFSCARQISPLDWEPERCCQELRSINCSLWRTKDVESKLLCGSQLEEVEQQAAKMDLIWSGKASRDSLY